MVLGRAGYDLYSAEPGARLDQTRRFQAGLGGSSANIAVGLARLGWRVSMAAAVSRDAVGRFIQARLRAEGIRLDALQTVAGHASSLCLTQIAPPDGAEQVFYRGQPADAQLRWTPALLAALRTARGGLFLTNGTSLCARPARTTTRQALAAARRAGMTTVLDVDYRASSWPSPAAAGRAAWAVLPQVDVLLANQTEMRLLAAGARRRAGESLARAARTRGVRVVVCKLGARGAVAYGPGGRVRCPAAEAEVVSTVGAGDGFAAGFLDGYARGWPLAECLARGNLSASWVVARVGCAEVMPRAADLPARATQSPLPPAAGSGV